MQVRVFNEDRKHGVSFFYDFNMIGTNICLDQARDFICKAADWHGVNLDNKKSNREALEDYRSNFPDSLYVPDHWQFKAALQPYQRDIQIVFFHLLVS